MQNSLSVEYLGIIEEKNTLLLLESKETILNALIRSNKDIKIEQNIIKYKNLELNFDLSMQKVINKDQQYFEFEIDFQFVNSSESIFDEYQDLLKKIRTTLHTLTNGKLEIIKDDNALFYSLKSYPLIYEIENLMRSLIYKFLLKNFGIGWIEEKVFRVDTKVALNRTTDNSSPKEFLENFDFISYAENLFKAYADNDDNLFQKDLSSSKDLTDLENLRKNYSKRSLWERFIKSDEDNQDLAEKVKKTWHQLYQYRNQIAHNKLINKETFIEIEKLVGIIKPILIQKIRKIKNTDKNQSNILIEDIENAEANITQRPRTFNYLINKGLLKEGDLIYLKNELPPYLEFQEANKVFQAIVTGKLGRSNLVKWEEDNHEYSISGLTWHIFKLYHPNKEDPPAVNGNYHWLKNDKTLIDLFYDNFNLEQKNGV